MGYGGPGMWMPKQKEGKNWIVKYSITINGKVHKQTRKFRIRADATDFIKHAKGVLKSNDDATNWKFTIEKL